MVGLTICSPGLSGRICWGLCLGLRIYGLGSRFYGLWPGGITFVWKLALARPSQLLPRTSFFVWFCISVIS